MIEINRQTIAKKVAEASEIIRNRIKTEVKGKIVSVMFDVCTIATLSTFGVNVTYMENSKVVCRTLGIIKIEERHTAVNMADMLFDLLLKYGIPLSSVLSITTDTARNATNTSKVLNTRTPMILLSILNLMMTWTLESILKMRSSLENSSTRRILIHSWQNKRHREFYVKTAQSN